MAKRPLTENQYMELRTYEEGHPSWRNGGHLSSLLNHGYLRRAKLLDSEPWAEITEAGHAALGAFRERHGIFPPSKEETT